MEAVAHTPAFAKKVGVPQSVGKDFSVADKGRKFQKGDAIMMKKSMGMPSAATAEMMARRLGAKPRSMTPQPPAPMGMKKGGMAHGGMHKMPNGKMMKNSAMKEGGMPMKDGKPAFMMGKKKMMGGGMAKYAKGGGIESRGKTKGTMIRMAAGGSVSARADGIAQRGKTRG